MNKQKLMTALLAGITALNLAMACLLVAVWRSYRSLRDTAETPEITAPEQTEPPAETTAPAAEETVPVQTVSESDLALYQAQCREIAYDDFARDSDAMKRQYFTFTGKIRQAMEEDGHYRLGIRNGSSYSDIVYLDYQLPAGSERILEGDFVTVWGVSEGLYTYTSVSDEQITVPRLHVGYLERLTDAQAAELEKEHYARYECGETLMNEGCRVTLLRVLSRVPDAQTLADYGMEPGSCAVWLLLEIVNENDESTFVSRYDTECFVDNFITDFSYDIYESPDGFSPLSMEELDAGYGVRGYMPVTAPEDWETLELRFSEGERFLIHHTDLE